MKIYLKNIQTIDSYTFNLPDKGLLEFIGNNSNGKSVLGKSISGVVKQKLQYDDERLPLIRDGCDDAIVAMEYEGKTLMACIFRDVNKCFYMLQRKNGEKIVRYLREKGIDELIREFGFLVYCKNTVCPQLHETFGQIPFINVSGEQNKEIIDDVITDRPSEIFITHYEQVSYPKMREAINAESKSLEKKKARLALLKIRDEKPVKELMTKLGQCVAKSKYLKFIPEIDIQPLPSLNVLPEFNEIEKLPIWNLLYEIEPAFNFVPNLQRLKKIREGRCPECGKMYMEGIHGNC